MEIKHKIWLEEEGMTVFGPGRNEFFKMIEECQSLNSAAKKLHISYRLIWGKIKDAEARLGVNLVEIKSFERRIQLSKTAKALLAIFDDLEKEIAPILKKAEKKCTVLKRKAIKDDL
ncbi:MAG: LysR family transcriptional regulator [Smithella sp.]|jgi:molybdate transport system regulatory protein